MKPILFIIAFILVGVSLMFGPFVYNKTTEFINSKKVESTLEQQQLQQLKTERVLIEKGVKQVPIEKSIPTIDRVFDLLQKFLGLASVSIGLLKIVSENKKKPVRKKR